jgi:hypothetical protein
VAIVSLERQLAGLTKGVGIYSAKAFADAAATALTRNSDEFTRAFARTMKQSGIPANRMKAANKALAEQAQTAILEGWHDRLPVKAPGYRKGTDPQHSRLSGALGAALADSGMTRATTDRAISFLNTGILWEQALHWHRVNYGAFGPIATPGRTKPHPVTVDGHTIFELHDPGRPDPESWLPRRWISGGREYFRPDSRGEENKADVPGGGHRSALFTELGFQSVAKNMGATYKAALHRWVDEEGAKTVSTALKAKKVRVSAKVLAG